MRGKQWAGLLVVCIVGLLISEVGCGGGGGAQSEPPSSNITVAITPSMASLTVGATQQFTATVSGTTNQGVTWSVNGIAGGNNAVGTISTQGVYTAPGTVPSPATTAVRATSQADSSKSASATVSLSYPTPSVTSVTPSSITASVDGADITVTGLSFVQGSTVSLGGLNLSTSFVSGTQLTAFVPGGDAIVAGSYPVSVTNPTPGGGASTTSAALAIAPVVTSLQPSAGSVGSTISVVTIGGDPNNPSNNSLIFGQTGRSFTTTVTGAIKQAGGVVLTANVPSGLAPTSPTALLGAPATLSVTTGGVAGTSSAAFEVQPPPHAYAMSPSSAEQGTSLAASLEGAFTNFDSTTQLATDDPGLVVSNVTVQGSTLITASLNVGSGSAVGIHTITATSNGAIIPFSFAVLAPSGIPLTLSSLSANSFAPMTPITLLGSGFTAGGGAGSSLVLQYSYGSVVAYLPATTNSETEIDSLVPLILDPVTGQFYTGPVSVQVIVNGRPSNGLAFTMVALPANTGPVGAATLDYVSMLSAQVSTEKSQFDSLQGFPADRIAALDSLFAAIDGTLSNFAGNVSAAASGGSVTLPDGSLFGRYQVDILDRLIQSAKLTSLPSLNLRVRRLAQLSGVTFQMADTDAASWGTTCKAADWLLDYQSLFQAGSWTVCITSLIPAAAPVLGPLCGILKAAQYIYLAVQLLQVECDILPINLNSVGFSPPSPLTRPVNGDSMAENPTGDFGPSPALASSSVTTLIDTIETLSALHGFGGKQLGQLSVDNKVLAAVFGEEIETAFDVEVQTLLDQGTPSSFDFQNDNTSLPLTISTVSLLPNPNFFVSISGLMLTPEQNAGRAHLYLDTSAFRALDSAGRTIQSPFGVPGNSLALQITTVVSVSPNTVSIAEGAQQQFAASVLGTPDQAVIWSVDEVVGGSPSVGVISTTGLYIAPAVVGSHTITATSAFDQSTGNATITVAVVPTVTVTVSPSTATIPTGGTQQFTGVVSGASDTSVIWSINGVAGGDSVVGTVSGGGLYTAPAAVPNPAVLTLTASSTAYPSASGSATLTIVSTIPPGTIMTVAGGSTLCQDPANTVGDGCPAANAFLLGPTGTALDQSGNLYIADLFHNRVRAVNMQTDPIVLAGVTVQPGGITTIAGNGNEGFTGDNGPATSAELSSPTYAATDTNGNVYIADWGNNVIRAINMQSIPAQLAGVVVQPGDIATVAGGGSGCAEQVDNVGDGCLAPTAELNRPNAVRVDSVGNLYIADFYNNRIRRVDGATGVITTVAGTGYQGVSGDDGPATSARLFDPSCIALDQAGNLYIADYYNYRVRKVDAMTGIITTVAGTVYGYAGDGGPATSAELSGPKSIDVDTAGNIYIADSDNLHEHVRVVNTQNQEITVAGMTIQRGTIQTIAGNGLIGYAGDGGPAINAELNGPTGVFVDVAGDVYFADSSSNVVRKITGH
jgi:sugar lactone lactonase YvrE